MEADYYNPKVFYIEDPDEQDQCQFVYAPIVPEGKPARCQKMGKYRIGLTIFLCGVHMPGMGRHLKVKPVKARGEKHKKSTMVEKVLKLLVDNCDRVVTYDEIFEILPSVTTRQYMMTVISNLRAGHHIVNFAGTGYKYLGKKDL